MMKVQKLVSTVNSFTGISFILWIRKLLRCKKSRYASGLASATKNLRRCHHLYYQLQWEG